MSGARLDAWLWLDVSFVLFFGAASGMLAWSAILRIARASWAAGAVRLGHSAVLFLPFSFAILVGLILGIRQFAPWAAHPIPGKQGWLNVPFLAGRNLALAGIFIGLSAIMVRWSLQADSKEEITDAEHYRLTGISVAVVLSYVIANSILAWDFIMSLTPEWVSTMFAPYYWVTNLHLAMAIFVLLGAIRRRKPGTEDYLGPQQFQDMGNLMLAFSLFSMGLFFAQYLTIWYSNLPMETGFLVVRYLRGAWPHLGWTAFGMGYALPFLLLQSRILKRNPIGMCIVAILVIIGVALERYVLVVPSLLPRKLLLTPLPGLITAAILGIFILSITQFMRRNPPISAAQAVLRQIDEREAAS